MALNPIVCSSTITNVEVFARGARVTRSVHLPSELPEEACAIVVESLTPILEPSSARVEVKAGDRQIVGLKHTLDLGDETNEEGSARAEVTRLTEALEALLAKRAALVTRRDIIESVEVEPKIKGKRAGGHVKTRIADATTVLEIAHKKLAELDARELDLIDAIERHQEELRAAQLAFQQATNNERAARESPTRSTHIKLAEGGQLDALDLVYVVHAARWWPAYTARLTNKGEQAELTLEAFVTQATQEDWSAVRLSLSTADLELDLDLPKLAALKLGRAQPPTKTGYRPPPEGLELMFAAYDTVMSSPSHGAITDIPAGAIPDITIEDQADLDDEITERYDRAPREEAKAFKAEYGHGSTTATLAYDLPSTLPPPASAIQMPTMSKSGGLLGGLGGALDALVPEGKSAPLPTTFAAAHMQAIELQISWRQFDYLVMATSDSPHRGRLRPDLPPALQARHDAIHAIDATPAPLHAADPLTHRGHFDHRYVGQSPADVPSAPGQVHRITLDRAEASSVPRFRSVSRETQEVFREIHLENPFSSPLLAGPIDVFMDGALTMTSSIDAVDKGGTMTFGLGAEDRLRVARNVTVRESTRGLLGGSTQIDHTVEIELRSHLANPAHVTLVDRVPVTGSDDIEVELKSSSPPHKPYDQADRHKHVDGGLVWKLVVEGGETVKVRFSYSLTLASKYEIVGGNRRE